MKYARMITIVATVACAILMIAAPVMATDYTFEPPIDCGIWNLATNWTPTGGPPGATDKATIPTGLVVKVDTLIADDGDEVGSLVIEGDGQVLIDFNCRLTLHAEATSTVEGSITFRRPEGNPLVAGELKIDGDVTVNGVSGTGVIAGARPGFVGGCFGTLGNGRIFGTTGSSLTIGEELEMLGTLDVEVELINNGRVGVDTSWGGGGSLHSMKLMTNDKSGTGDWFAERGELIISVDIDTSGDWFLDQTNSGLAEIQIDHALNLTGDLTIDGGLLDVNETFCTTGKITFTHSTQPSKIDQASGTRFFTNKATCP